MKSALGLPLRLFLALLLGVGTIWAVPVEGDAAEAPTCSKPLTLRSSEVRLLVDGAEDPEQREILTDGRFAAAGSLWPQVGTSLAARKVSIIFPEPTRVTRLFVQADRSVPIQLRFSSDGSIWQSLSPVSATSERGMQVHAARLDQTIRFAELTPQEGDSTMALAELQLNCDGPLFVYSNPKIPGKSLSEERPRPPGPTPTLLLAVLLVLGALETLRRVKKARWRLVSSFVVVAATAAGVSTAVDWPGHGPSNSSGGVFRQHLELEYGPDLDTESVGACARASEAYLGYIDRVERASGHRRPWSAIRDRCKKSLGSENLERFEDELGANYRFLGPREYNKALATVGSSTPVLQTLRSWAIRSLRSRDRNQTGLAQWGVLPAVDWLLLVAGLALIANSAGLMALCAAACFLFLGICAAEAPPVAPLAQAGFFLMAWGVWALRRERNGLSASAFCLAVLVEPWLLFPLLPVLFRAVRQGGFGGRNLLVAAGTCVVAVATSLIARPWGAWSEFFAHRFEALRTPAPQEWGLVGLATAMSPDVLVPVLRAAALAGACAFAWWISRQTKSEPGKAGAEWSVGLGLAAAPFFLTLSPWQLAPLALIARKDVRTLLALTGLTVLLTALRLFEVPALGTGALPLPQSLALCAWGATLLLLLKGARTDALSDTGRDEEPEKYPEVRAKARWGPWRANQVVVAICLLLGCSAVAIAAADHWVTDDAFISFRYARNLVEGRGFVYNEGEYFEGYTNPLLTLFVAAGFLADLSPVLTANTIGLVSYAGLLVTLYLWSKRLGSQSSLPVPLAMGLCALQSDFHVWATGGLETTLFAFLSALGIYLVLRGRGTSRHLLLSGGLMLALTCWTRPDGVLFAVLGLIIPLLPGGTDRHWRERRSDSLFVLAPLVVLGTALAAFKWGYYGRLFPAAYYVKAEGRSYFGQGLGYILLYFAKHWASGLALVFVPALLLRRSSLRRLPIDALVAGFAALFYALYVARTGGDFMFARRIIPALPFAFIFLEALVRLHLSAPHLALAGSILVLSAFPARIYREEEPVVFGITDERNFYANGLMAEHRLKGRLVGDALRPFDVKIAYNGSLAAFAYESRLPYCVERFGLTQIGWVDKYEKEAPVGHKSWISEERLRHEGIHFAIWPNVPEQPPTMTDIRFGDFLAGEIITYDHAIMDPLLNHKGVHFTPIERVLAESFYIIEQADCQEARNLFQRLDNYYLRLHKSERQQFVDRVEATCKK